MKQFEVINYLRYRWMTCGVLLLGTLKFETKLQKCIKKGIIVFNFFHLGSYIVGYICGNHVLQLRRSKTKFSTVYQTIYQPQMKNLNMVIP